MRRISFQYGVKGHLIIAAINRLMSTGAYDKIFLVTEKEESLTAMVYRYGEKLVYYKDVIRNNIGDIFLSVVSDWPQHHFLMNYEVLRDACTLAICKSLVAGISNVSISAKIMKLSMKDDYTEEVILSNGLLDRGLRFKKYRRKFKKAKRQTKDCRRGNL